MRTTASKVPEITALFWVAKVLSTGMGETASDFLVRLYEPVVVVACGFIVFAAALALQFAVRRHIAWVYWLAVSMVSVFGTMVADVMHIGLGVPYEVSTPLFAGILAVVFVVWRQTEKSLSIHTITTPRREAFYWATVITTFALGTAAGDLTATTFHLGYLGSGLAFLLVITIPAMAYRWFNLNAVAAFWFTYIVTRPLGASFADWMGVPAVRGGLDWGTGPVTLGLAGILVVVVAVTAARERSVKKLSVRPIE